jgi:hypothetical protein
MTPQQKTELTTACERGDDVRIVTLALAVAATAARENRRDMAIQIREIVDIHLDRPTQVREYYRHRLEIAQRAMGGLLSRSADWEPQEVANLSIRYADALMVANAELPNSLIDGPPSNPK